MPVLIQRCWINATDHRSEHRCDDDHVVGIAEDRHEVGHEIKGRRKVRQEEQQPGPVTSAQRAILRQIPDQADHVRYEAPRLGEVNSRWRMSTRSRRNASQVRAGAMASLMTRSKTGTHAVSQGSLGHVPKVIGQGSTVAACQSRSGWMRW